MRGKTLLHLGAAGFQVPAITRAVDLGCRVVTADNRPDNPGHRFGQVYENVSTVDMPGILAVARRHGVDGVMTYGSDVAAPTVCHVAEQLGLPGNPYAAARLLQRKDLFRAFQAEVGLPHPAFFSARSADEARAQIARLAGRVVVKPADSSGSKGQSVIASADEVEAAFHRAAPFSRCGAVVFEEFLEQDLLELDGDLLFQDGMLAFRHYGHNYFREDALAAVPCGEIFPGFFSPEVESQLDRQFRTVIEKLGLRNGCMNFDGILRAGTAYILDLGLRNGGNFVPDLIQLSTGFDLTRAAVFAALGLRVSCERLAAEHPRPVASYILNSHTEGAYRGVEVSDRLRPYLVETRVFVEVGAPVLPFDRGDRALGMVFFLFPDMATLRRSMRGVERDVQVIVEPA